MKLSIQKQQVNPSSPTKVSLFRQTSKRDLHSSQKSIGKKDSKKETGSIQLPKIGKNIEETSKGQGILIRSQSLGASQFSKKDLVNSKQVTFQSPLKRDHVANKARFNINNQQQIKQDKKQPRVRSSSRGSLLISSPSVSLIQTFRDTFQKNVQSVNKVKKDLIKLSEFDGNKVSKGLINEKCKINPLLMKISQSALTGKSQLASKNYQTPVRDKIMQENKQLKSEFLESPFKKRISFSINSKSLNKGSNVFIQNQLNQTQIQKNAEKQQKQSAMQSNQLSLAQSQLAQIEKRFQLKKNSDDQYNQNQQNKQKASSLDQGIKQIKPRIFYSFSDHTHHNQQKNQSSSEIPYNVLLRRTINVYKSYDLNAMFHQSFQKLGLGKENQTKIQNKSIQYRLDLWGTGQWKLEFYDNEPDYIYEYIGLIDHLSKPKIFQGKNSIKLNDSKQPKKFKNSIRSVAFDQQSQMFLPFLVHSYFYDHEMQFYYFSGQFSQSPAYKFNPLETRSSPEQNLKNQLKSPKEITLHRLKICFSFESPVTYLQRVQKASSQRQRCKKVLKFHFLVENIEPDMSEKLPGKTMRGIKEKISLLSMKNQITSVQQNHQLLKQSENLISLEEQNQLNLMYRTVNCELLLRKVLNQQQNNDQNNESSMGINQNLTIPFSIELPPPFPKKPSPPLPLSSPIVIKFNNSLSEGQDTKKKEYIKLYMKSIGKKIQQFQTKSIYHEHWLATLMIELKILAKSINLAKKKESKHTVEKGSKIQNDQSQDQLNRAKSSPPTQLNTELAVFDLQYLYEKRQTSINGQRCHKVKKSTQFEQQSLFLPSKEIKIPSLEQFLSINLLSKIQNYLKYEINGSVISRVIQQFDETIDKYQQKRLYVQQNQSQQVQNEADEQKKMKNNKHQLSLEHFYQRKLARPVLMIEQILKQEVKILLINEIKKLCSLVNFNDNKASEDSSINGNISKPTQFSPTLTFFNRIRQVIKIELDLNSKKPLLSRNYSQTTSSQKSMLTEEHKLSEYLQFSLTRETVIQKFANFFFSMLKNLNTSLYGIEKMLILNKKVKKINIIQMLSDGDKWLKIFKEETLTKQDIKDFIQKQIQLIGLKSNRKESKKLNNLNGIQSQFLSLINPLIQNVIYPLTKQIEDLNKHLDQEQQDQFIETVEKQESKDFDLNSKSQKQSIENRKIISSEELQRIVSGKLNLNQVSLLFSPVQLLLNVLFYLKKSFNSSQEMIQTSQQSSIVSSIINLTNLQKKVQLSNQNLSSHNLKSSEVQMIKISSKSLVEECRSIEKSIKEKQKLVEVIQFIFSTEYSLQSNIIHQKNLIVRYLTSRNGDFTSSIDQRGQQSLISVDTSVLSIKLKEMFTSQILAAKRILLQKFTFEVKYVDSQIQKAVNQLMTVPHNVQQLIEKMKYIESLSKGINSLEALIPSLQMLIELCFRHSIKIPKDILKVYYQNNIQLKHILRATIPSKVSECMLKKDLIYKEISQELKELDDLYVEFSRNLQYLKQETLNIIQRVHSSKRNPYTLQLQAQSQQSFFNEQLQLSNLHQHQDPERYDLEVPQECKTEFYFTISDNVHKNYQQIAFLCEKIKYKEDLFQQIFTGSRESSKSLSGSQLKVNACLPHSPQSLEPLYIEYYNLWYSLTEWNKIVQDIYTNELGRVKLSKPEEKIVSLLETLIQVKRSFMQKLEDKINFEMMQRNLKSTFSIVFGDDENQSMLLQISRQFTSEVFASTTVYKEAHVIQFLDQLIRRIKWFLDQPLKLLKILKKEGFEKKHLQQVELHIQGTFDTFTLKKAILLNFLEHLKVIEAVSNDAWFSYHLENTLERILQDLSKLKFSFKSSLDRNGTEILNVTNYSELNQKIDEVLINLETIHKNPAKQQFEVRLKNMHKQALYINKCLQMLQIFQAKFLLIHPIFESLQIIKQLPVVNQKFLKIYRPWIQIVTFMRRMASVLNTCNSQNIYQKISSMLGKLEVVQSELSTYLETKRKSYSRFFFLSDNEMFQLYSRTKHIDSLSKMIGNVIPGVDDLDIDEQRQVKGIKFGGRGKYTIPLQRPIHIKDKNIEVWLYELQKCLKQNIFLKIQKLLLKQFKLKEQNKKRDYLNLIEQPCSQAVILVEQVMNYSSIIGISSFKEMINVIKEVKSTLNELVNIRKNLIASQSPLSVLKEKTLSTLFILNCHKLQILEKFKKLKLQIWTNEGKTSYEYSKLIRFLPKIYDNKLTSVSIESFNAKFQYGCEFVGIYQKLVITDLSERVNIMYLGAISNQQGNALLGPAATGKSETAKEISHQFGKSCLVYNCSKNFQVETLIRILKGSLSSGAWICFDQFNLLEYSAMAVVAENLYILFKYRAYNNESNIDFQGDSLLLKPTFHLSITYNPNYEGRQTIPSIIKNVFRTVAMIKVDIEKICTINMWIKGFGEVSNDVSKRLTRIFRKAENEWGCKLYDFGLRNLVSVINLAEKNLKLSRQNQKKIITNLQEKCIVQSLITINLSRMNPSHKELFMAWINEQFDHLNEDFLSNKSLIVTDKKQKPKMISQKIRFNMTSLKQFFEVRNGVILYGKPLSGKEFMIDQFLSINKSTFLSEKIFVNVLTSKQIYGQTNLALNIWSDGVLTRSIKNFINLLGKQENKQKSGVLVLHGQLHYDWMQALNTVLDNSKVLNLGSGESINIPSNLFFVFVSQNLKEITPATLSRNGIMFMERYTEKEIMDNLFFNSPALNMPSNIQQQLKKIKILYEEVIQTKILSCSMKYNVQKIFVLYSILNYLRRDIEAITLEKFVFLFIVFYEGFLTENGRKTLKEQLKNHYPLMKISEKIPSKSYKKTEDADDRKNIQEQQKQQIKAFLKNFFINKDNDEQYELCQYEIFNDKKVKIFHSEDQSINSYRIFVKTERIQRIQYFWKNFTACKQNDNNNELIVVFGQPSCGKSAIINSLRSSKEEGKTQLLTFEKVFLTRSSEVSKIYNSIEQTLYKKSSHKLGALPGGKLVIQIDDMHLSPKNSERSNSFSTNYELLRMILKWKEWYNYKSLEKERIQDLIFIGDWRVETRNIGVSEAILTHALPIFLADLQDQQVGSIFSTMIHVHLTSHSKLSGRNNATFISELQPLTQQIIHRVLSDKLMSLFKDSKSSFLSSKNSTDYKTNTSSKVSMNDLDKIIKSVFQWTLSLQNGQIQDRTVKKLMEQLLAYQILRVFESRINNAKQKRNFQFIISKLFPNIQQLRFQDNNEKPFLIVPKIFVSKKYSTRKPSNLQSQKILEINNFISQVECIVDEFIIERSQIYHVKEDRIVVFREFAVLLVKLLRTFLSPKSNALFLMLPMSGKRTLMKLCAYMLKGRMEEFDKNYQRQEWLLAFKNATKLCFKEKSHTIFYVPQELLNLPQVNEDLSQYLQTYYMKEAYIEADFQELIYILQSFLIKNNLEVNRQNCKYFFVEHLKSKFHLILNLYPGTKETLRILNDYPAFLRECNLFTFTEWPSEALVLATEKYIEDDHLGQDQNEAKSSREEKLSLFVQIHKKCKQINENTEFQVWDGQYFTFMQTFNDELEYSKHILALQKQNLQKGLLIVQSTEKQIDNIRVQIKKLQPAIIQLQKQTQRAVKAINIQKVSLLQFDQSLSEKNNQCKDIIEKSAIIKNELDSQNKEVNQKLDKIWKNVDLIKQSHIAEIKSLNNPSQFIRIVLTALCIIFYHGPIIRQKDQKGIGTQENYFETAKKHVLNQDAQTLANMLTGFDKQTIQRDVVIKIEQKCMTHKKWSQKEAKNANKAIFYFFLWVQAIVKYFHVNEDTQPLRKQLRGINVLIDSKTREFEEIKVERERISKKINELTSELEEKQSKLAEYSGIVNGYNRIITRGEEILGEIKGEKLKWQQYLQMIETQLSELQGNCIMRSTLMTYGSMHSFQTRSLIKQEIKELLQTNNVIMNETYWQFKPMLHNQLFQMLEVSSDEYIKDNLMIMESSHKPITLLDPEEEGVRYLLEQNSFNDRLVVIKVNEQSENLQAKIEEAITEKRLLLIQISSAKHETALSNPTQAKNKNLIKNLLKLKCQQLLPSTLQQYESLENKRFQFYLNTNQILSKRKYQWSSIQEQPQQNSFQKLPPQFNCYFYTRSSSVDSIEFLTKTQVVNFSMTEMQLQSRLIKLLVACEFPDVQLEIDQNTKFSAKSKIQLQEIQVKLLDLFVKNQASYLIHTDQTMQVLTSSNKLYLQITEKLNEAKQKRIKALSHERKFQKEANKLAKVYFVLKKLQLLSKSSIFSFSWFQRLLVTYPKSIIDMVVKQASASVEKKYKVIVQLLVSSAMYPKLQWSLLFNKQRNSELSLDEREMISSIASKLQMGKTKVEELFNKIKAVSSHINGFEAMFKQLPRKFKHLTKSQDERKEKKDIFSCIPDEFSQLQLFDKCLLISCFRPEEQILGLISTWLKANFPQLYSFSSQTSSPLSTHYKRQAIILIFDQDIMPLRKSEYIDDLYKRHSTSQRSPVSISMVKCDIERLKMMFKAAKDNNQWIVVQGIVGSMERVAWAIMEFLEQNAINLKKEDQFKVFVTVDSVESQLLPEFFVKLSKKIRVKIQSSIQDKISQAYFRLSQSSTLKSMDERQRNQRKYMLSQICIFHYFLAQKTNYGQKLWNQRNPTIEQHQLEYMTNYILSIGKDPEELRDTIPAIAMELVYGWKLSDEEDRRMTEMHIQDVMKVTALERTLFWQSLWANDKFPKSLYEYKQYVKMQISNIRLFYIRGPSQFKQDEKHTTFYQLFGIDQRFVRDQTLEIYTKFKEIFEKKIGYKHQINGSMQFISVVRKKIREMIGKLETAGPQISLLAVSARAKSFVQRSQRGEEIGHKFKLFLNFEKENYIQFYSEVKNSLQSFLETQPNQLESYTFYEQVHQDKIPKCWKTLSKLGFRDYIFDLVKRIQTLAIFVKQSQNRQINSIGKSSKEIDKNSCSQLNSGQVDPCYNLKSVSNVHSLLEVLKESDKKKHLQMSIKQKPMGSKNLSFEIPSEEQSSASKFDTIYLVHEQLIRRIQNQEAQILGKSIVIDQIEIKVLLKVEDFNMHNCSLINCEFNQKHDSKLNFKAFIVNTHKVDNNLQKAYQHQSQTKSQSDSLNDKFYFVSVSLKQYLPDSKSSKANQLNQKFKQVLFLSGESKKKRQSEFSREFNNSLRKYFWQDIIISQYPLHYNIQSSNYHFAKLLFVENDIHGSMDKLESEISSKRVHLSINI